MFGTYSEKQAELTGVLEYLTPTGETVLVTEVGDKPGAPDSAWDDKIDQGEVTKRIRRVSDGTVSLGMSFLNYR